MNNILEKQFNESYNALQNYSPDHHEIKFEKTKEGGEIIVLKKKPNWLYRVIRWIFGGGYQESKLAAKVAEFFQNHYQGFMKSKGEIDKPKADQLEIFGKKFGKRVKKPIERDAIVQKFSVARELIYNKIASELKDGQGEKISIDGSVENGNFKNGLLNGDDCKKIDPDGTILRGRFEDGKLNGQGKIVKPDGKELEGSFKNDELDGMGKITGPNGYLEEGNFEEGKLIGQGVKEIPLIKEWGNYLTKEEGVFKNGSLQDGERVFARQSGIPEKKEKGEFEGGRLKKGEVIASGGVVGQEGGISVWFISSKTGTFNTHGELEGQGEQTRDGVISKGFFKDGILEGAGELTDQYSGKKLEEGTYVMGLLEGKGSRLFYKEKNEEAGTEVGDFKNGNLHGYGKRILTDGSSEIGNFVEGLLEGTGERIYKDGTKETGTFVGGWLQGKCVRVRPDGNTEKGLFEKGILIDGIDSRKIGQRDVIKEETVLGIQNGYLTEIEIGMDYPAGKYPGYKDPSDRKGVMDF